MKTRGGERWARERSEKKRREEEKERVIII